MTTRRQALLGMAWLLLGTAPAGAASRPRDGRAKPPPGRPKPAAPARPKPARKPVGSAHGEVPADAPKLLAVDREQAHGWLEANPDWTAPERPRAARHLRQGRPLPPGLARRMLPPGLAATLPYFPGYRYYAVGPDLVLVASGTGLVTSLLPGALAR